MTDIRIGLVYSIHWQHVSASLILAFQHSKRSSSSSIGEKSEKEGNRSSVRSISNHRPPPPPLFVCSLSLSLLPSLALRPLSLSSSPTTPLSSCFVSLSTPILSHPPSLYPSLGPDIWAFWLPVCLLLHLHLVSFASLFLPFFFLCLYLFQRCLQKGGAGVSFCCTQEL